jgi:hypothetical protein
MKGITLQYEFGFNLKEIIEAYELMPKYMFESCMARLG